MRGTEKQEGKGEVAGVSEREVKADESLARSGRVWEEGRYKKMEKRMEWNESTVGRRMRM
jgi:hypothetical protein